MTAMESTIRARLVEVAAERGLPGVLPDDPTHEAAHVCRTGDGEGLVVYAGGTCPAATMQWAYMEQDDVTPCASEAQARVRAWLRRHDDPDVFVVHRPDEWTDWESDDGLTFWAIAPAGGPLDVLATADGAAYWLYRAEQWAASGTWSTSGANQDADRHLAALRREAAAHGHDVETEGKR